MKSRRSELMQDLWDERQNLIRQLNEIEERIAAVELAFRLMATQRQRAIRAGNSILGEVAAARSSSEW